MEGVWDGAYAPEQTYGPHTTAMTQIAEVEGVACPGSCAFDFTLAVDQLNVNFTYSIYSCTVFEFRQQC